MKQEKTPANRRKDDPMLISSKDRPQFPELPLQMPHMWHPQSQAVLSQKLKVVKYLSCRIRIQAVYKIPYGVSA